MKAPSVDQATAPAFQSQLLVWLAATVIGAVAVYNNIRLGIWIDEAFAFDTATGSFVRTFHQALNFEMQPPVYYLLLNVWLRMSPSIEFGRFLSTACVLLTVPVLYHLAKALRLSTPASLPLLAAVCPFVLWAASEGRQYGLMLLLTSLATLLYVRLLMAREHELALLTGLYLGVWYLSLLTYYYSGALLAAQIFAALVVRRRAGRVIAAAAAVALLMLPWVPTVLMQASDHPPGAAPELGNEAVKGFLAHLRWGFQFTLDALFMAPALRRPIVQVAVAVAIAAVVVAYWRARRPAGDPMLRVFVVTAILPIVMILSLTLGSSPYSVQPRHLGFAAPGVLSLMALVADRFPWPSGRRLLGIAMILFGVLCTLGFQRNNRRTTDWEAAARFVSTHEAPGEVIFVFEPDAVLPFRYYYRGSRPVFGLPVDRIGTVFSIERHAIQSVGQVAARVQAKADSSGRFWVVARHPRPVWGRALLDRFLRQCAILRKRGPIGGIDVGNYQLIHSTEVAGNGCPTPITTLDAVSR